MRWQDGATLAAWVTYHGENYKADHTDLYDQQDCEELCDQGRVIALFHDEEAVPCGFVLFPAGHNPAWCSASALIEPGSLRRVLQSDILEEVAVKAFAVFGVEFFRADLYDYQIQAIALLERFGFEPEAQIRKYTTKAGKDAALLYYVRSREA